MFLKTCHALFLFIIITEALYRSDKKEKKRESSCTHFFLIHTFIMQCPKLLIRCTTGLGSLLGHGADSCFAHWKGDSICDKACNNALNDFDCGDCSGKMNFRSVHEETKVFRPSLHVTTSNHKQSIGLTKQSQEEHHVHMYIGTTGTWTHVRRGQSFAMQEDKISNLFATESGIWIMRLEIVGQDPINLKISSKYTVDPVPNTAPVGIHNVSFVDPKGKTYPAGRIVVLFNPYLKGSPVHGSSSLKEYIEDQVRH